MRALFAVIGFVVFYVVTIAAVAGLGWLGVTLLTWIPTMHVGRGTLTLVLVGGACLIGAGVLAWSALPRIDRFEPPGPELTEAAHPELFAMIREVARATGQRMPVHVYGVLEVNAFVTERGGIMGIGSRRVMGIGLGLLDAFSVDEVRGVIAHELGHFHGGDTRLGPWVYKTRAAMGRSVINLRRTAAGIGEIQAIGFVLAIVEAPFRWMALGYMRLASAVSRAQEYSADAVAARAVGTEPVLSAFGKLAGTSAALDAYFEQEVAPLVSHGVVPPVLAGARRFVEAHREELAKIDAESAKLGEESPFDSHPPLPQRIAAIRRRAATLPARVGAADDRPAISLVRFPEKVVRELIAARIDKPLRAIEWDEAAPLFVRDLFEHVRPFRGWLAARSIADLDRSLDTARAIVRAAPGLAHRADALPADALAALLGQVYFAALAIALQHHGYTARTAPGEPLRFHRGDEVVELRDLVRAYLRDELSDAEWIATWERHGLGERPWSAIAWPAAD